MLMTNWQTKTIGELVDYEQPSKYLVKDTNYIEDGTPVLTANKAFVLGYTHETEGIYVASKDSPVIIFDDFTTDNKFVDFDFKVKSSAIKILTAKRSNALPRFVHGAMQLIKTEITEHKRRFISEYQFHPIDTPELAEQQRIVGVLEVWDEYIEKLEQKIALKEQLKKGLMQQLLAGKRRLPGFSGEWQKTRIGDISNVIAGGTPSTSRQEYWNGGNVLWMKSGEINKTYLYDTEHRITDLGLESSSAKILPMNSVLIALAGQGSTRGKVAINKVPLSTNQSVAAFIPTKRLHYGYLFWNLSTRYDELRSLSAGDGGRGGLNLFILKNLKIKLPEFNEQREICAVLDKCNEEINSLVNYKGLIHRQKKYLLKNLITGTIRTPEDLQPLDASRLERSAL